ncbi:alpha/beta fold hydrolase [Geotalea toluenoxydans]|uniref:alpha/beta fold hydrolase n=1 Tax=Geotalea toluenoxydans TaxID=421624 RepID=UPI001FB2EB90|nr:alpha/beta hydrolase [Geotalea toluenoxydans]
MSSVVWSFQRELADRRRLITMDLRGHGQSAPSETVTLEAFANDLIELFTRLDLHDAILVGWSMGVQVVLQAFKGLRPRLAGLVLVGGTPRFSAAADYPHLAAGRGEGDGCSPETGLSENHGRFFSGHVRRRGAGPGAVPAHRPRDCHERSIPGAHDGAKGTAGAGRCGPAPPSLGDRPVGTAHSRRERYHLHAGSFPLHG